MKIKDDNKTHYTFETALEEFDMGDDSPGLIYVKNKGNENITPYERIALETAEKYKADAIYFRKFIDNRPSIPQIYLYNCTPINRNMSDGEIANLHRRLWNSAQVPFFIVFRRHCIQVFNSLNPPGIDKETGKITLKELLKISARYEEELDKEKKKFEEFSARKFDNGSFWDETKFKKDIKSSETINEKLLTQLKFEKDYIVKRKILSEELTNKLLVMIILIKYLEERKDEKGNRVFPEDFFENFTPGAKEFSSVLRTKGACLKLFDALSEHFNGRIFEIANEEEIEALANADLTCFADFLEGRLDKNQYVLWPLYSFEDLPVELISNIYEDFLAKQKKEKGIVYTPQYLVNFLVDECMPLQETNTDFKILDPACGSGIFLVTAYKRLVFRWRKKNNWQEPTLEDLKKLLKDTIFGVDQSEEAVRLAAFSLCLALCDMLSPAEWHKLTFENLFESNLIAEDFFKLIEDEDERLKIGFDLVIGNPPFVSKFNTKSAQSIAEKRLGSKKSDIPDIPDKQLSLLFLDQAIELCKDRCLLCLLLPAGPFLYNQTSGKFREYFLNSYNTLQIIDFTSLQSILFKNVQPSVIAVFTRKEPAEDKDLFHITVHRTQSSKENFFFELDYYDFHRVPFKEAINNRHIWKSNLLGGGRIKYIVERFTSMRSLNEYLDEKCKNENWVVGEGFIVGNRDKIKQLEMLEKNINMLSSEDFIKLSRLQKKYAKANYITGQKTLPPGAFTEKGIDESKLEIVDLIYFYRVTLKFRKIFEAPHILIKETAKKSILAAFRNDYLTFTNRIVGIHAPAEHIEELKLIEKRINEHNRTYLFLAACYSAKMLIKKSTVIEKIDIDRFPYPDDEKELELFSNEKILVDDVVDYMLEFHRNGENSKVMKKVNPQQLEEFSEIYCRILNSVFKDFKPMKPTETDSFVCFPFFLKEKPEIDLADKDIEEVESYLDRLIFKPNELANVRMIRVLKIYNKNVVYLIKPNQLRYWLKSIAVRDADDTFADLLEQGY